MSASVDDRTTIVVWGGPEAGKTAFLGALYLDGLFNRADAWDIHGNDEEFHGSTEFIVGQFEELMSKRFPPASTSVEHYGFFVNGRLTPGFVQRIGRALGDSSLVSDFAAHTPLSRQVSFRLNVRDYPGGHLKDLDAADEMWDYIVNSDAIIFLFDPVREMAPDDHLGNTQYLLRAMHYIRARARKHGRLADTRLPHYVAVCVSKFDDPLVFQRVQSAGLLDRDCMPLPVVKDPRAAFRSLAKPATRQLIETNFLPNRVEYFMTSSIGFFQDDQGNVSLEDYQNVVECLDEATGNWTTCIRGEVRPINVLEPLVRLHTRVVRERSRGRLARMP